LHEDDAMTLDPHEVRFSQDSIREEFQTGGTIEDLADALRSGRVLPETIPPIRVVQRHGLLYSLDNRRLEAFRKAGVRIPYRLATAEEERAESWKFTTKNQGRSIRIRRSR
jgi:hypothetical protein